jgi:hypothetical protein
MRRLLSSIALVASLTVAVTPARAKRAPSFDIPEAGVQAEMMLEPSETVAPRPMPPAQADAAVLRSVLEARRAANLAIFHAYVVAGEFPSNVYKKRMLNVWKDTAGHPCAVANMVIKSGNTGLFDQVAETDNFIRVADVKEGEFFDWILTSGFTKEELILIQRPFRPVVAKPAGDLCDSPQVAKRGGKAVVRCMPVAMPTIIDADKKAADVARLTKAYAEIEAKLNARSKRSIELAVKRLMADRDLALSTTMYARR